MADKKLPTGDGQTRSIANLVVETTYLDGDYEFHCHGLVRGETGLLRVFSLVPKHRELPSFEARVDDGSSGKRREIDLDIDIKGVTEVVRRDFRAERNGYLGHHTDRSPTPNVRSFEVTILIPGRCVFEGTATFTANFQFDLSEAAEARDSYDVEVIRHQAS
jgi:hypothetical protein